MKTTIDISNNILFRAKKVARENDTTLRALVEEGLELVLAKRMASKTYRYRPVTFKGTGLHPEFREGGWAAIRDAIYKGHGS